MVHEIGYIITFDKKKHVGRLVGFEYRQDHQLVIQKSSIWPNYVETVKILGGPGSFPVLPVSWRILSSFVRLKLAM